MGEAVYEIVASNIRARDECSEERLVLLEARKQRFVRAFNDIIAGAGPQASEGALSHAVATALLPLVDSNALPELTHRAALALDLLVNNPTDPTQRALQELMALAQARTVLSGRHLTGMAELLLHDPDIESILTALAELGATPVDGRPSAAVGLELIGDALDSTAVGQACAGASFSGLHTTLLTTAMPVEVDTGPPAYAVWADAIGNPQVRKDPSTGALYEPFVDRDQDGTAETNSAGQPVDRQGKPIYLPPFGWEGARDAEGRLLAADGQPLYDYFDAKRTGLAAFFVLAGEAVQADVHQDLVAALDGALGSASPCEGGCCYADDHPLRDLIFAVLEDFRYQRIATLLATWREITYQHPDLAEDILVAVGQLLDALHTEGLTLTQGDLIDLFMELMPLLADIFAQDNATGESTARLLMDVVNNLGQVARDLPGEMAVAGSYVTLAKDKACSAEPPDLQHSTPVDFTQPRWIGSVDNRSSLEQSIELLSAVDCGSVPFTGGKSVAEVVLDVMADRSPATACQIIDLSLGAMNILPGVSKFIGAGALDLMGCDGGAVWDQLWTLDALAKSGALDAYLPIAKAFKDRGQLRTLIDMFHLLAADLHRDEGGLPGSSTLRRAMPTVVRVLNSGAADAMFDLFALMASRPAVDGDGTMADVLVDSFAYVTNDTDPVRTRYGTVVGTSHALEMLRPYRELIRRWEASGTTAHVDRLVEHVSGYLRRTEVDTRGTLDPADDRLRLRDRRLVPVIDGTLDFAAQTFDLTEEQRTCAFDGWQSAADTFLGSPQAVQLRDVLVTYMHSPTRPVLDNLLVRALTPASGPALATTPDLHGGLTQVASGLVLTPTHNLSARALARFGASLTEIIDGPDTLALAEQLLLGDQRGVMLGMIGAAVHHGEGGLQQAPVEMMAELAIDLASMRSAICEAPQQWTLQEVAAAVEATATFLTDDTLGLPAIYRLIHMRTRE